MARRRFGVEEEFLLVDPDTGEPIGLAGSMLDAAAGGPGEEPVERELQREQVETASTPCATASELAEELRHRRRATIELARRSGAAVAAVGTSPLPSEPVVSPTPRYEAMRELYGRLAAEQLTCGCHVHVEVGSLAEGVGVLDRIGPWLPVLRAMTANSPFWQGTDTGYGSYRTTVWNQWPAAGPTGPFGSVAGYEQTVAAMLGTGTLVDEGMVYFDARLAREQSTVELRAADVCLDVDDAVLLAALGRALVDTVARRWRAGEPAASTRHEVLRLAHWRASRSGLTGDLVGPWTGRPEPAHEVLAALREFVGESLRAADDEDLVRDGLARLHARGTGAEIQRGLRERSGSLRRLVRDVVQRTGSG